MTETYGPPQVVRYPMQQGNGELFTRVGLLIWLGFHRKSEFKKNRK
jgi:hypothetical protein